MPRDTSTRRTDRERAAYYAAKARQAELDAQLATNSSAAVWFFKASDSYQNQADAIIERANGGRDE